MVTPWLGLIELGVVLLFVIGWGILELVCRRLDRKREVERRMINRNADQK